MDRLVDSLLAIREEIAEIERGEMDAKNNPLKVRLIFANQDAYFSTLRLFEREIEN